MAATTKTPTGKAAHQTHRLLTTSGNGHHQLLGRQYADEAIASGELTEDDDDEEGLFAKLALGSANANHQRRLDSPQQNRERKNKSEKQRFRSSSSSVSPSSLQSLTTDSDSLQGDHNQQHVVANRNHLGATISPQPSSGDGSSSNSSSPNGSGGGGRGVRSNTGGETGGRNQHTKSPILIKYNYYDYNGERQENYEIQQQQQQQQQGPAGRTGSQPIQRTLSPTFQASLDQIVRSSQAHLAAQRRQQMSPPYAAAPAAASPPSSSPDQNQAPNLQHSPQQNPYTMTLLARRYKPSSYEHRCLRCAKTVYQMDKVGPLKDFTFYHQNCFKCRECGTKLTLKTYFNNQHSSTDQEVYCHRHCPKTPAGRLDNQSVGIRAALNAPKVFDPTVHQSPLDHQHHLQAVANYYHVNGGGGQQPQVDSRALYIQHATRQTKLQAVYKAGGSSATGQVNEKISQFLNRRLEYLEPKQKLLEARHRQEEEQLFKVFEQKWLQEESCIRDQIRDEWQRELSKLFEKHKQQMSSGPKLISNNNNNNIVGKPAIDSHLSHVHQAAGAKPPRLDFHRGSAQPLPVQASATGTATSGGPNGALHEDSQEKMLIELERMNLEKTMTLKLDKKKETLKRKLREFERQATAELVEKQSREMLQLISLKLEEFKEEQRRKIGSDLEHFEAIESLANHLGASLQVGGGSQATEAASGNSSPRPADAMVLPRGSSVRTERAGSRAAKSTALSPSQPLSAAVAPPPPLPKAPMLSKMELYNSEQPDEVFRDIDELAINVAKEDQRTFTDLVHHLTRHCLTDVEKVRALFRWITVKNLNTMHFDSSVKPDTPLGLLRGIKQGSESYHVLFKRLCSYAGLHCVVIKGFSKSAGYQPGVRFEGNRFRNSWNAVYVAGAWRFVQCNWGARHLVSVAVMQDRGGNQPTKDKGGAQPLPAPVGARSSHHHHGAPLQSVNLGRRGQAAAAATGVLLSPIPLVSPSGSSSSHSARATSATPSSRSSPHSQMVAMGPVPPPSNHQHHLSTKHNKHHHHHTNGKSVSTTSGDGPTATAVTAANDSLRYEYDDHYFLTDPDEFIYEFFPLAPEWQLLKSQPISLGEFEQLPFVRSLFFKYGLYFPQPDIRSVLYTNSSGATTIKIGMPTHMIPSLIFHYNLKYFDSDLEHSQDGTSLKRFVMQSVESGGGGSSNNGSGSGGGNMLSNIVSFRVHVPENGAYILDIFANSTTPDQYITGEPMKFKSVCKFKIIARHLKSVMVPLPDCASGEYGPMKATRLFGIIPLTHETGLISVAGPARHLEIQFRMTRPLLDFMASLHKNGHSDERQLAKLIKIYIEGDIVYIAIKFQEEGQYGLDIYTRDQGAARGAQPASAAVTVNGNGGGDQEREQGKKQLLTHCCKYLINIRAITSSNLLDSLSATIFLDNQKYIKSTMNILGKYFSPSRKPKSSLDSGPPHYSNPGQLTDPSYVNQGYNQCYQNIPLYNPTAYNPATLPHFPQQQQQQPAANPNLHPHQHHHQHQHQHPHQQTQQHQPIQSFSTPCTGCCPPNAANIIQSPQQAMTANYSANNFGYQYRDSTLQETGAHLPSEAVAVGSANASVGPNPQTIQYQNFSTQSTVFPTTGPTANHMVPNNGNQQQSRFCEQSYYSNQIMTSPQQLYQNHRSQQLNTTQQQFQAEPRTTSVNNLTHNGNHDDQKHRQTQQQQHQPRIEQQQHVQTHQLTNDMSQMRIQQQQQQYQNHDELTNGNSEELPLDPALLMYERDYEELHKTASSLRVEIKLLGEELNAIRKKHPYEVFDVKI